MRTRLIKWTIGTGTRCTTWDGARSEYPFTVLTLLSTGVSLSASNSGDIYLCQTHGRKLNSCDAFHEKCFASAAGLSIMWHTPSLVSDRSNSLILNMYDHVPICYIDGMSGYLKSL